MPKKDKRRGIPIGASPSQPLGNFTTHRIDHQMKERLRVKIYLRYCDDTVGMARTKAEAWKQVNEFERMNEEMGLVIKHDVIVAPFGKNKNGKHRKRQRGHTRREKH